MSLAEHILKEYDKRGIADIMFHTKPSDIKRKKNVVVTATDGIRRKMVINIKHMEV